MNHSHHSPPSLQRYLSLRLDFVLPPPEGVLNFLPLKDNHLTYSIDPNLSWTLSHQVCPFLLSTNSPLYLFLYLQWILFYNYYV